MEMRTKNGGKYNDFLQLMINAQNKIEKDENDNERTESEIFYGQTENYEVDKSKFEITEVDILATSFLFFIAGYETTATTLSFLSYALALNQEAQQRLYEEIKSYGDDLTYD